MTRCSAGEGGSSFAENAEMVLLLTQRKQLPQHSLYFFVFILSYVIRSLELCTKYVVSVENKHSNTIMDSQDGLNLLIYFSISCLIIDFSLVDRKCPE